MTHKHFLKLLDFQPEEINDLLDLAHQLKDTLRSEIPELGHVLIHVEPDDSK